MKRHFFLLVCELVQTHQLVGTQTSKRFDLPLFLNLFFIPTSSISNSG